MHSYGRGDEYAADKLRPHFLDLYDSAMELIQPLLGGTATNDQIFDVLDDIARMVNAHPDTSPYFGIQRNEQSRQILYLGFKIIHNLDLYKTGKTDFSSSGNAACTLTRSDTRGHAYEQMVYGVVFILYCLAQPRTGKTNASRYHNWRKLLEQSRVPFYPKNAIDKGVADWLKNSDVVMDQTVKLREEWQRGQNTIRLSHLEARMVAFADGNDDISEEAINRTLQRARISSGTEGYKLYLPQREGVIGQVMLSQGQAEVELIGPAFELSSTTLDIFEAIPETAQHALNRQPFEKLCAIGVFEGLGLKIGRIDNYSSHTRLHIPFCRKSQEYVLSRQTLKHITG